MLIQNQLYITSWNPKNREYYESKGERQIKEFLLNNSINFIQEKRFEDCRDKNPLPFDFYLPDYNTCIEFDGEQHYIDKGNFSTSLEYVQYHDYIKTLYCYQHQLLLIRIPYWEYNSIEKRLKQELNLHKDIV